MKYKKKPVVIDAIQWDGTNAFEVIDFCKPRKAYLSSRETNCEKEITKAVMRIETLEGDHFAKITDMIIKGVAGECYPCDLVIFNKTYEKLENEH